MRKTTNLDDIRIFVAVAEAGTFSAAAAHLQLPASTISRSLTRLEKHLDLLLVRGVSEGLHLLTPARNISLFCKRALRLLREGRELLDKHRASPSGLLRIACPITMARDLIAPLLSKFMEAFPDLRVELETYSSGFDQEPKEDIDVFFKVRVPKTRRAASAPTRASLAVYSQAVDTYKMPGCLPNQQTLLRIFALVPVDGRSPREGRQLRPISHPEL